MRTDAAVGQPQSINTIGRARLKRHPYELHRVITILGMNPRMEVCHPQSGRCTRKGPHCTHLVIEINLIGLRLRDPPETDFASAQRQPQLLVTLLEQIESANQLVIFPREAGPADVPCALCAQRTESAAKPLLLIAARNIEPQPAGHFIG